MKFKKFTILTIATILALSLQSCGSEESSDLTQDNKTDEVEVTDIVEEQQDEEQQVEEQEVEEKQVEEQQPEEQQDNETSKESTEEVSREFKNALKSAETYSNMMHMSKQGLYDQLVSEFGENFPADAAQYAVDNVNADWKENAFESAKTYSSTMSMSNQGIYDQLVSEFGEKFTPEEAKYAIDKLNSMATTTKQEQDNETSKESTQEVSREFKNALASAETYSNMMNMSKQAIYEQLVSEFGENFPADAAQYAVDNVNADWNKNALESAKTYSSMMSMSNQAIYDQLVSQYGDQFTPEEAQYAIDNLQ